jgi:hypothetical protein
MADPEQGSEQRLMVDPRFQLAVDQFNSASWYACHDSLEDLWHETEDPLRRPLQGLLQIAVAHLHLEQGNVNGAMILMGEGLGRLNGLGDQTLGVDLNDLRPQVLARLKALQSGLDPSVLPLPQLQRTDAHGSVH